MYGWIGCKRNNVVFSLDSLSESLVPHLGNMHVATNDPVMDARYEQGQWRHLQRCFPVTR
jgi:hypothetical protein